MLHHDVWSGRERMLDMRAEVERNRLEARLAKARLSKDAELEEAAPRKRSLAARGEAVLMALFE
jgi:hypothetical protein